VRRLAALGGLLFIILVLVVAQLVLPGIAAQRLRDRLATSGQVRSVSVSAFPAIELLWHQADSVSVSLGRYRSTPSGLTGLLNQTAAVDRLKASAAELDTGLLTLRNATLRKSGAQLSGSAEITESDLRTALPVLNSVTPVSSGGGRIIFQGTATLLGVSATVTATLAPQSGSLLVTPNVPLGGLATIRVFSDPRVTVEGVAASRTVSGFAVTATGRIR
jgi:LmeA-like phospholipid-binding